MTHRRFFGSRVASSRSMSISTHWERVWCRSFAMAKAASLTSGRSRTPMEAVFSAARFATSCLTMLDAVERGGLICCTVFNGGQPI